MANQSKPATSVTAKVHDDTLAELAEFTDRRKQEKRGQTYNRTDAINEILPLGLQAAKNPKALEVGLIVLKHIDKLDDPQWVADMKKRLEEIAIVDFVESLPPEKLDALATIVFDELRLKAGKKPFSVLDHEQKRKILLKD